MSFNEFIKQYQALVEQNIEHNLGTSTDNNTLIQSMRYAA